MEVTDERRRNMHKAAGAFVGGSRRRREAALQIRKKKRDEVINEKRKLNMENCSTFENISLEERQKLFKGNKTEILELLNKYVENLSTNGSNVIADLLTARILAKICEIAVSCEDECALLAQKLLTSSYTATSSETPPSGLVKCMRVIKCEIMKHSRNSMDAVELFQSLSLFVEHGSVYRNVFFIEKFLKCSVALHKQYIDDPQVDESFLWLLSLLCRDLERYPPPERDVFKYVFVLSEGMCSKNLDFKNGCIKVLSAVASSGPCQAYVIGCWFGIVEKLLEMVENENAECLIPIVSILCCVAELDAPWCTEIYGSGLIKTLVRNMSENALSKDICFLLYHLCEQKQEEAAIQAIEAGALQKIPIILERMGYHTRREAVFFLSSLLLSTGPEVLEQIIQTNILRNLSDLLTVLDSDFLEELLTIFQIVLGHGEKITKEKNLDENPVAVAFEEFGGRARLDYLVQSNITRVSAKAQCLLEEHFERSDEQLYVL